MASSREKMACPYFMPVERLENGSWPHPARLPLGAGWHGHCTAPDHDGATPDQQVLEASCTLGYATSCPWAPQDRPHDAVRFAVAAPLNPVTNGAESSGAPPASILRLQFVCEKAHLPVQHGVLEFDLPTSTWIRRHDDPRMQKMAQCFLESYLRKKA